MNLLVKGRPLSYLLNFFPKLTSKALAKQDYAEAERIHVSLMVEHISEVSKILSEFTRYCYVLG